MNMRKRKLISLSLILIGLGGFFLSMHFLGLFGTQIEYTNINYILKDLIPLSFITIGMYGIGYLIGENRLGIQWTKWWIIIFISAWVIGFLARIYIPTFQPFLPLILFILAMIGINIFSNRSWRDFFKNIFINPSVKNVIYEFFIIFLLLSCSLLFESFGRDLIYFDGKLNHSLIGFIIFRSFIISICFVFAYKVSRTWLFTAYNSLFEKNAITKFKNTISVLSDVFITTAAILVFVPVRPVLQETFRDSNIADIKYIFVRHDLYFSVFLLLLLAIPIVYLILKYQSQNKKQILITIVSIIFIVGALNSQYNYDARLSETRASWVKKDFIMQEKDALNALKSAKTSEEKAYAYYWLGVSSNRQGNHEKAAEYQLESLKLMPDNAAAHASLANAYLFLNKNDLSLSHSNKCIEYDPDYAWCYQSLGNYYFVNREMDLAVLNLKKATELDPTSKELAAIYKEYKKTQENDFLMKIQSIHTDLTAGRSKEACQKVKELFNLELSESDKSEAHRYLGVCLRDENKIDEAIIELNKAINLSPKNTAPYLVLSGIYSDKGMMEKAFEYANKTINIDSDFSWGYNQLGYLYVINGEKEKGIEYIRKAISLNPFEPIFKNDLEWALKL